MQSECSSKIYELQETLRQIKSDKLALEQLKKKSYIASDSNTTKRKHDLEQNINKLTAQKNKLNEELIENEEIFESIKMKYAIMLLLNFGNS